MPAAALAMSRSGGRATDDVGPQHVHVVGVLGEESTELADRLLLYAAFERRGFDREDTGSRFGAERSSEASLVGASLAVRRGRTRRARLGAMRVRSGWKPGRWRGAVRRFECRRTTRVSGKNASMGPARTNASIVPSGDQRSGGR